MRASGAGIEHVLAKAQRQGLTGPAPVREHVRHAMAFADALGGRPPSPALDLGSGGGLPGLVLASRFPGTWVLLDARRRAGDFLRTAAAELGLAERVEVVVGRAEVVGRARRHRGTYALVTARAFGPPAVVAECAAPLLLVGGTLAVSEPPIAAERWPDTPLAALGLEPQGLVDGIKLIRQVSACPDRFPRREGVPAKRPLF